MVFQRPNPLPISIYENVVFGVRVHAPRGELSEGRCATRRSRRRSATCSSGTTSRTGCDARATTLPLEQQQKLCIARLLPLKPEVILMDEPCSALDAEGTSGHRGADVRRCAGSYTIVIVTHNMAQARRASDECIFMLLGEMVEHARTEDLFLNPRDPRRRSTSRGRYG